MRGGPFGKGCLDPEATWDRNCGFIIVKSISFPGKTPALFVHAKGEL